jgi:hypothetical protein
MRQKRAAIRQRFLHGYHRAPPMAKCLRVEAHIGLDQ